MSASFAYDGFGRRAAKTVNGASTAFVYDGWNAVEEKDGSSLQAVTLSGLGLDTALSRRLGDDEKTLLTDALGSTVATVGGDGQLAATTYGPFGEGGGSPGQPIQYTGRENDGTGLLHYRHRYYSPSLKRFISEDPAAPPGAATTSTPTSTGDPINATDPLGLWPSLSLQDATTFAAGFGDTVSFGLTNEIRDVMGTNGRRRQELRRLRGRGRSRYRLRRGHSRGWPRCSPRREGATRDQVQRWRDPERESQRARGTIRQQPAVAHDAHRGPKPDPQAAPALSPTQARPQRQRVCARPGHRAPSAMGEEGQ